MERSPDGRGDDRTVACGADVKLVRLVDALDQWDGLVGDGDGAFGERYASGARTTLAVGTADGVRQLAGALVQVLVCATRVRDREVEVPQRERRLARADRGRVRPRGGGIRHAGARGK
eukprot:SAG31_NODE_417_length_15907_cov_6.901759_14_plen_118_part_00